ncbi:MAG: glycosyltransferase family 39 protein [Anaerolineae bacterium]|nr:glycosyltransferase family 39 protein [Anaerolineae bacterium]
MALNRLSRQTWLLAAVLVAVTIIALPTVTYPLGRDQGEFATIGRGILDGRIPYVDLWNPKPPAVFYVYALAMTLFGRSAEALRLIDLLIFPPVALSLYWIGRRVANLTVGMWSALLFGVFYFTETFWTLTQNDGIVLLPMCLALICALKAASESPRTLLWAFASGALCACVIWFKYPFVFFVLVPAFACFWLRRRANLPLRWRDMLAFSAGGLLVGLGGIAYMVAIGAWAALLESARVTASYTALGFGELSETLGTALYYRWLHWGALFLLALAAAIVALLAFAARRFSRVSPWWIVVVWLFAAAVMLLVQLKLYDYHWLPLPPSARSSTCSHQPIGGSRTVRSPSSCSSPSPPSSSRAPSPTSAIRKISFPTSAASRQANSSPTNRSPSLIICASASSPATRYSSGASARKSTT